MWREILGLEKKGSGLAEILTPRRTFSDVILPEETRRQLYEALTQIEKHRLIFTQWGLGERHPTGLGLVFNFAGPPGTGKTICAEAVAYALGRKLLRVRYSELESCWAGETGKNIRSVFREARAQDAVLFFDEADSVAARRFSNVQIGYEREANQSVNILLKEVEEHEGVVVFATNMAANFDPAFERRIRTHILFRIPNAAERQRIWEVQVHPDKTPLGADVDFRKLAERFEIAGGDIRNAVLKAAQIAAAEEGPDETKHLLQRHFVMATEQVLAAKQVMQQNAVDPLGGALPVQQAVEGAEKRLQALDDDLQACRTELGMLEETQGALDRRLGERLTAAAGQWETVSQETRELRAAVNQEMRELRERIEALGAGLEEQGRRLAQATEGQERALQAWKGEQETARAELTTQMSGLEERLKSRFEERLEARLVRATLIPMPRAGALTLGGLLLLAAGALGHFLLP